MNKILRAAVLIFFFTGLTTFVWYQGNNLKKKNNSNNQNIQIKNDTLSNIGKNLDGDTLYKPGRDGQPNDSLIRYRISLENEDTPIKEINLTDRLIKKYLDNMSSYYSYSVIASSKTMVIAPEFKVVKLSKGDSIKYYNESVENELKKIADYRAKLKAELNK